MSSGLLVERFGGEVRAHAVSLRRTALMLTGEATTADALVVQVFQRMFRVWGVDPHAHEASSIADVLCEELVRTYLRRARRRRKDRSEVPGFGRDPFEVLSALPPRKRAAVVLMEVEGWTAARSARALGVRPGRVASLVPRSEGLAAALVALAYRFSRPGQEIVAEVLRSLSEGSSEVGSGAGRDGGTGRAMWTRLAGVIQRRRSVRWLAAASVVVLGTAAAAALLNGMDDPSPRPLTTADGDGPGTLPGDLAARGWILDGDGDPPTGLEGLRLIESTTIDYATATEPLALDIQPAGGYVAYAVLWCDIPALDPNLTVPTATLELAEETVVLPCAGNGGDPAVRRFVPLPPPVSSGKTPASITWAGDLPARGSAVLATYSEAGWASAPGTSVVVPQAPPPVPQDAAVLDSDSVRVDVDGVAIFVQRVSVSAETHLSAWSGQTGVLMVLVDGVIVSDDGDRSDEFAERGGGNSFALHQLWRDQDPELREGSWTVYAPGGVKEFVLPEVLRPAPGEEREVTVSAVVDSGPEGRWRVQATHAWPVEVEVSPVPESTTDAPILFRGHRLVAAWEVPATGYPYPLVTPASVSSDTVFTSIIRDDGLPNAEWTRCAAITSDLGTTSVPNGVDEYWALEFMQFWPGWEGGVPGGEAHDMASGSALGEVSVSILGCSSADHATVLAYEPVP